MSSSDDRISWTVSGLVTLTDEALSLLFPQEIWLCGVLSGYKETAGKHRYFRLVEYDETGKTIVASIDAVAFYNDRLQMGRSLKGAPKIDFRDNVPVRLLVKPAIYVAGGRFQVIVRDIDPYYTTGALERRRDQILRLLSQLGIAKQNLSLAIPRLPMRLAVVTSSTGEAWHDFMQELRRERANFDVKLFDIRVQGRDVEPMLLKALTQIAEQKESFDLVCIIRGGGSAQDLSYFDTEEIAKAVALFPIKVVIGIGHERDRTVLDEFALSVKTPTAAARFVVEHVRREKQFLIDCGVRIGQAVSVATQQQNFRLQQLMERGKNSVSRRLDGERFYLNTMVTRLKSVGGQRIGLEKQLLLAISNQLNVGVLRRLQQEKLILESYHRILLLARNHLLALKEGVRIVGVEDEKEIDSVGELKPKDSVAIWFADGYALATIDSIHSVDSKKDDDFSTN